MWAGFAAANPAITLPDTPATIDVPTTWKPKPTSALVAAYRGPQGTTLAIARAQVPNTSAWIDKSKQAYANEIERGAKAARPGLHTRRRKLHDIHGVPALDLELRSNDGTRLVMRILLFRTYALTATIELPRGVGPREARAIVASFGPPRRAP